MCGHRVLGRGMDGKGADKEGPEGPGSSPGATKGQATARVRMVRGRPVDEIDEDQEEGPREPRAITMGPAGALVKWEDPPPQPFEEEACPPLYMEEDPSGITQDDDERGGGREDGAQAYHAGSYASSQDPYACSYLSPGEPQPTNDPTAPQDLNALEALAESQALRRVLTPMVGELCQKVVSLQQRTDLLEKESGNAEKVLPEIQYAFAHVEDEVKGVRKDTQATFQQFEQVVGVSVGGMAQKIHEWGHVVQTLDARLLAIEAFEFANLPQHQAVLQERLGHLEADFAGWGRWASQGFESSEEKLAHVRSKVHSIDENVRMIPSSLAEIRGQLDRVRESAHEANGLARESEKALEGVLGHMEVYAGDVQVAQESGQNAMELAERVSLELHVLREAGGGGPGLHPEVEAALGRNLGVMYDHQCQLEKKWRPKARKSPTCESMRSE